MKKVLLIGLLVVFPLSAYAGLQKMDDSGLGEISAQEGVKVTIGGSGFTSATNSAKESLFVIDGYFVNSDGKWINSVGDVVTDANSAVEASVNTETAPFGNVGIDNKGYYVNGVGQYWDRAANNGSGSWVTTVNENCQNKYSGTLPSANLAYAPLMQDALKIKRKSVSTAWTNTNSDGNCETGIVNKVIQSEYDKIYVKGDLTIMAYSDIENGSSVVIGLPEVAIENGSKKTEIYITSRTTNLNDDGFIDQVTGAGATGKLGSHYTEAGFTYVKPGSQVSISALP